MRTLKHATSGDGYFVTSLKNEPVEKSPLLKKSHRNVKSIAAGGAAMLFSVHNFRN